MGRKFNRADFPLESCPFCGKVPKLHKEIILIPIYNFLYKREIENPKTEYYVRCKCGIRTKLYKTPSGAQRAWNRRCK